MLLFGADGTCYMFGLKVCGSSIGFESGMVRDLDELRLLGIVGETLFFF